MQMDLKRWYLKMTKRSAGNILAQNSHSGEEKVKGLEVKALVRTLFLFFVLLNWFAEVLRISYCLLIWGTIRKLF